ncbi:MAG: ATP-binding protein [Pontixanthobacter sp.]
MRLWPRNLLGQMLLTVALALLVAQTISATLLWRAAENRRDQIALNAAAFRLAVTRNDPDGAEDRDRRRERGEGQRGRRNSFLRAAEAQFPRALRLEATDQAPIGVGEKIDPKLAEQFGEMLAGMGVVADEVIVLRRTAQDDGFIRGNPRLIKRLAENGGLKNSIIVAGIRNAGDPQWRVARVPLPPPQNNALRTIIAQTLLIYVLLVGLHFLLLRRITRPLAALTQRTEKFGHGSDPDAPLPPEGPEDIRRLITAHNAMETRIAALLDEKDVMLGAIGHDLKTPLAALRVRIESVEDETERGKMASSIEDINSTLDDILGLARIGRNAEAREKIELSALVANIVEEYEDQGLPVNFDGAGKLVGLFHAVWIRRALRNLIDNALRYAGTARVKLGESGGQVDLTIEDDGPGIPDELIADMLEPFRRGEASRNRGTGGSGLGLTLARAIAEQHGGTLKLSNRRDANGAIEGLNANLRLPLD